VIDVVGLRNRRTGKVRLEIFDWADFASDEARWKTVEQVVTTLERALDHAQDEMVVATARSLDEFRQAYPEFAS
jgi:hypothetical protein